MPPSEPVLSARKVTVDRGTSRVLNSVDLSLYPGETVALQGPSGSGKSTLLGVLSGLITPKSGVVQFGGAPFSAERDRVRSRIRLQSMGLVFQGDEFLPELSMMENVTLPIRLGRSGDSALSFEEVATPLMRRLGIDRLANRMPSEVSGGQLQRAAIARALVHQPSVVLADEPTGSLDEESSRGAMTLLLETASAIHAAVLLVTHSDEVAVLCHQRVLLSEGGLLSPTPRLSRTSHA